MGRLLLVLLLAIVCGCGSKAVASQSTRSCGFQSLGKGWYLRATPTIGCSDARLTFKQYFSTRGCNGTGASACVVGDYRCRYDYGDDVERVRCATAGRLITFRSLP